MKIYRGNPRTFAVQAEDWVPISGTHARLIQSVPLSPRLDLRRHCITGYGWGARMADRTGAAEKGDGDPRAQLAIAILADYLNVGTAIALYMQFRNVVLIKRDQVAELVITGDEIEKFCRSVDAQHEDAK